MVNVLVVLFTSTEKVHRLARVGWGVWLYRRKCGSLNICPTHRIILPAENGTQIPNHETVVTNDLFACLEKGVILNHSWRTPCNLYVGRFSCPRSCPVHARIQKIFAAGSSFSPRWARQSRGLRTSGPPLYPRMMPPHTHTCNHDWWY